MKLKVKSLFLTFIVINAMVFTIVGKSNISPNLVDLKQASAWGGETPDVTYYLTADSPQPCTNCCPKETYTGFEGDMKWNEYSGSVSVGGTININGIPITIQAGSNGTKGYYTGSGSSYTGTSDGSGTRHICGQFSWTSSCKAGVACPSRVEYR